MYADQTKIWTLFILRLSYFKKILSKSGLNTFSIQSNLCNQIITSMSEDKKYTPNTLPLGIMMLSGGVAASIAQILTIPLDTAKVRLQVQGGAGAKYHGMFHCIKTMAAEQGITSLYKGLNAGLQRQMVFASLRIGLYEPVKRLYVGDKYEGTIIPMYYRILAGLTTGAIGIIVANPTDVVKIRFQGQGRKPESERRYKGVTDAYIKIVKQEGLKGLWTGLGPNIIRNSIINAAEIATFDYVKDRILQYKLMDDNIPCHLVSSGIAGFTACVIGSPVDVLKTRIMNAKPGEFTSIMDCVVKTFKQGPLTFYNGFQANANRIVSWNILMFVSLGIIRKQVYQNFYKQPNQ